MAANAASAPTRRHDWVGAWCCTVSVARYVTIIVIPQKVINPGFHIVLKADGDSSKLDTNAEWLWGPRPACTSLARDPGGTIDVAIPGCGFGERIRAPLCVTGDQIGERTTSSHSSPLGSLRRAAEGGFCAVQPRHHDSKSRVSVTIRHPIVETVAGACLQCFRRVESARFGGFIAEACRPHHPARPQRFPAAAQCCTR